MNNSFTCNNCGSVFSNKYTLKTHQTSNKKCIQKRLDSELSSKISEYEDLKQAILSKPVRKYDLDDLTEHSLREVYDHMDLECILEPQDFVSLCVYYALKGRVLCNDMARKQLYWYDSSSTLIIDSKGIKIAKLVYDYVQDKFKRIMDKKYFTMLDEQNSIRITSNIFSREHHFNVYWFKTLNEFTKHFVPELCNQVNKQYNYTSKDAYEPFHNPTELIRYVYNGDEEDEESEEEEEERLERERRERWAKKHPNTSYDSIIESQTVLRGKRRQELKDLGFKSDEEPDECAINLKKLLLNERKDSIPVV